MNYEDMSDFEVNSEVAEIVTGGDVIEKHDMAEAPTNDGVQVIYKIGAHGEFLDYCNNPSDAWPIMIANNIFITATREDHEFKYMTKCLIDGSAGLGWTARFTAYSDNPLRAAMICFLKMKDAENE